MASRARFVAALFMGTVICSCVDLGALEGGSVDGGSRDAARDSAHRDSTPRDRIGTGSEGSGNDAGCGALCTPEPAAGTGWAFVSFERGSRGPCPPGYDSPVDVVEAGGPATCGCTCGGGLTSCTGPGVDLYYSPLGCPTSPTMTASTTMCWPVPGGSMPVDTDILIATVTPMVTPCTPVPAVSIPPDPVGRVCTTTALGAGCDAGEVCLPPAPYSCIEHAGDVPCPGMGLARYAVGTSSVDTRGCATCSCEPGLPAGCADASLTLYADPKCMLMPIRVPADGACHPASNSAPIASVEFSVTPSGGGCRASAAMPTGTETPIGAQTLCCH